jgi:hypothetical protein
MAEEEGEGAEEFQVISKITKDRLKTLQILSIQAPQRKVAIHCLWQQGGFSSIRC